MQYCDFALVFLLYLRIFPTNCQIPPYSLSLTSREYNDNTLTLQCMDEFGSPVPNAVFYRNGVLNTNDECFNSSVSVATNKLRFTISPECDGHYMCGARNGNGVVLSKPITVYGEFVRIPTFCHPSIIHSSITLMYASILSIDLYIQLIQLK